MSPNIRDPLEAFCDRHYGALRAIVLALAIFNLTFRLGREVVYEWDEALYGIAAWELQVSGHWIGTTFLGELDYYNTKPPLNVWLIALSFKTLGRSLVSLRLLSVVSAALTVFALQEFARRVCGSAVALVAGVVLATTFGFLYVHAGRTAETDALFTLLVLIVVVALWAERRHSWARAALGPVLAAVFLLRGMAVLMPLAIVAFVWMLGRQGERRSRWPTVAAGVLFLTPVGTWGVLRWRLDRWRFFDGLFNYDFIARTFTTIEGHAGTPLYYFNILGKHQYDWLIAAAVAYTLFPVPLPRMRNLLRVSQPENRTTVVLGFWATMTFLLPTLMTTKLPWYLDAFYPAFALGVASIMVHALSAAAGQRQPARRAILVGVVVAIALFAEGKLLWYSHHHRDLRRSIQGVFLEEKERLAGQQVFRRKWDNAEIFVLGAVVGAEWKIGGLDEFWRDSHPGDCLVSSRNIEHAGLIRIRSRGRDSLFCRPREF